LVLVRSEPARRDHGTLRYRARRSTVVDRHLTTLLSLEQERVEHFRDADRILPNGILIGPRMRPSRRGLRSFLPAAAERAIQTHEIRRDGGGALGERKLVLLQGALDVQYVDESDHSAFIALPQ
jgi:hypothetical protein